jgi:hypothetical protein
MEEIMNAVPDVLGAVVSDVWTTVQHNWPFLLASVVIASALQVYVGTDRLAGWLRRRTAVAVLGAVALASLTPFCSCGTTAVVLGAMASAVPWAPVVAFMVSSPLTSPQEYVMSAGLFGPTFATTYFVAAIVIGLGAGLAAFVIERAGWLVGQARMTPPAAAAAGACACDAPAAQVALGMPAVGAARVGERGSVLTPSGRTALEFAEAHPCCATLADDMPVVGPDPAEPRPSRLPAFRDALLVNGRRLALYFLGFATLGYLLIELIPTEVLTDYLGGDSPLAVPLAALLGVPVYLNADGSLPMVASLMDGGMGAGPALAFLITGAGTSVGAVSGMLVIARRRVVGLVVGSLFVGAVVVGWLAPLWL